MRDISHPDGEDVRTVDNVREDLADGVEAVVRFEEGAVGERCCAAVYIPQDGPQARLHEGDQGLEVRGVGAGGVGVAVGD